MADGTLKVGTITTSSGSGNISIGSGVTLLSNVPAFEARLSASQSLAHDTVSKVEVDSVIFDTDSCYDNTTNYRFTPTVAGKYVITGQVFIESLNDDQMQIRIYKNGSILGLGGQRTGTGSATNQLNISLIDEANGSTDYYELYAFQDSGVAANINASTTQFRTWFSAYRIGA
jgi:hypothetical protein